MKKLFFAILLIIGFTASAQNLAEPETDPVITDRIAQWQDLKFGFMMHWGMYAQWGVVESWSICNEDFGTARCAPATLNIINGLSGRSYSCSTLSIATNAKRRSL